MKLRCGIDLERVDPYCGGCRICTPESKGGYWFKRDLPKSQELVEALTKLVGEETSFHCIPPMENKDPDIQVLDDQNRLVCRIEAKMLEDKPFIKVNSCLSGHDLQPKETIVVDYPKLMSYFARSAEDNRNAPPYVPTFVVWHLGRACKDVGGITVFQECGELRKIFDRKGDGRAFIRKEGAGDRQNGRLLGITGKYHFSIRECRPIEELPGVLRAL